MFSIAQRFGVSLSALIAANPQVSNPSAIVPGQQLCVPTGVTPPPTPTTCSGFLYTAVVGDTMFSIAQRFGVTLSALIAANPQISNPSAIVPGQRICVPSGVTPPPTPTTCSGFLYRVVTGDTMFSIARRFGVSLSALTAANPQITNPSSIFPGQVICIPR